MSSCSWFSILGEVCNHVTVLLPPASHDVKRWEVVQYFLFCCVVSTTEREGVCRFPSFSNTINPSTPTVSISQRVTSSLVTVARPQASLSILLALWCHFLLAIQVRVLIQYDEPGRNTGGLRDGNSRKDACRTVGLSSAATYRANIWLFVSCHGFDTEDCTQVKCRDIESVH